MKPYTLLIVLAAVGCSDRSDDAATDPTSNRTSSTVAPVSDELAKVIGRGSDDGPKADDDSGVVVHRVYDYTGYTWIEPTANAKRIAVDVELRNDEPRLDLDGVEIMNGETNQSYGGHPHAVRLTGDGKPASGSEAVTSTEQSRPLRVLLIYAVPNDTKSIKLGYWGQPLTTKSVPVTGNGPSLSKPAEQKHESSR